MVRVIGGEGGFGEPGGDLLFRRLSGSTIGAEGFHGRVRDGIGCFAPRCGHQAGQTSLRPRAHQRTVLAEGSPGGPSAHRLDRWVDPGPRAPRARRGSANGIGECARGSVLSRGCAGAPRLVLGLALAAARGRWSGLVPEDSVWIERVRAISTGQLHGLLRVHLRPIDVVVFHGSRRDLVLRRVSRLDAFSGYPVRT
jgi:hypothetical protein